MSRAYQVDFCCRVIWMDCLIEGNSKVSIFKSFLSCLDSLEKDPPTCCLEDEALAIHLWRPGEWQQGSLASIIFIFSQQPCLEHGSPALSCAGVPENSNTLFHPLQRINLRSFPGLGGTIIELLEVGEQIWGHIFISPKVQTILLFASSLLLFLFFFFLFLSF